MRMWTKERERGQLIWCPQTINYIIQLWAETALAKLRFTVKSSEGQLPTWTIPFGEKRPHYGPSPMPMHDEHLRPEKYAHQTVSPCICKRSEVKGTTDPEAAPELTVAAFCRSGQQGIVAHLCVLAPWHYGPSSTFSATSNKPSLDISGNKFSIL